MRDQIGKSDAFAAANRPATAPEKQIERFRRTTLRQGFRSRPVRGILRGWQVLTPSARAVMIDPLRQEIATAATTIVVKVGTRVLTHPDGRLHRRRLEHIVEQVHKVIASGRKVVLVSSGAVGAGMGRLRLSSRPKDLAQLQAVAAIGQSALVEAYERALRHYDHHAAQVLLTAEDLEHRTRYLNARNTLLALLELGAVPIINENDTVAVDELQTTFGDNDRLAAIVTNLIQAPLLVLLSDVEGLYDGDPDDPDSPVVPTITRLDQSVFDLISDGVGGLGSGGMRSKLEAAKLVTTAGENVIIAGGLMRDVLGRIIAGERVGTLLLAQGQTVAARKRWIGLTVQPRGRLVLDAGACRAVRHDGRSLLSIGVIEVDGHFAKGDVVSVQDAGGTELARGLTNYDSKDLQQIQGLRSDQIAATLGHCPYDEVIHRNNLVVTKEE